MRKFEQLLFILSLLIICYNAYVAIETPYPNNTPLRFNSNVMQKIHSGGHTYELLREFTQESDSTAMAALVSLRSNALKIGTLLKGQSPGSGREEGDIILKKMGHCVIGERIPNVGAAQIASTINKGSAIYMCIRDAEGALFPERHMLYVFLHELSHVVSEHIGHGTEFYEKLSLIVDAAHRLGLLAYTGDNIPSVTYCGEQVSLHI
jgi:hypothetical protein